GNLCILYPQCSMKDSTAPVTKADLEALWIRIDGRFETAEKSLAQFREEFALYKDDAKKDSQFVAEKLTEVLNRLDAVDDRLDTIDEKLDGERKSLLTDVHAFVGEDHAMLKDHARRLERLERKVGIAA